MEFIKGFLAVFKRELRGYFTTPVAYVFLTIFLLLTGGYTFYFRRFFDVGQASMRLFFEGIPWMFIFFVPAIAMRLWAEERKSNSIMLLFTLPITTTQAVLGKFAAALTVLISALALTFPTVITVYKLGNPDTGPIVGGYLGSILMAAAFLAIGSFFSALTRNQVIAFILAVVACGLFFMIGYPSLLSIVMNSTSSMARSFGEPDAPSAFILSVGKVLIGMMESLSCQIHFTSLQRGVIEVRNLFFFVVCTAGWLWANLILLEQRRAAR